MLQAAQDSVDMYTVCGEYIGTTTRDGLDAQLETLKEEWKISLPGERLAYEEEGNRAYFYIYEL